MILCGSGVNRYFAQQSIDEEDRQGEESTESKFYLLKALRKKDLWSRINKLGIINFYYDETEDSSIDLLSQELSAVLN